MAIYRPEALVRGLTAVWCNKLAQAKKRPDGHRNSYGGF
jgi:hypothetical protein